MVACPYAPVSKDSRSTIRAMVATTFMAAGAPVSQKAIRSSTSEPMSPTRSTEHKHGDGPGKAEAHPHGIEDVCRRRRLSADGEIEDA